MDKHSSYVALQTILKAISAFGAIFFPPLAGTTAVAELMELKTPDKYLKKELNKVMKEAFSLLVREMDLHGSKLKMIGDLSARLEYKIQTGDLGNLQEDALKCSFVSNKEFDTYLACEELSDMIARFKIIFYRILSKRDDVYRFYDLVVKENMVDLLEKADTTHLRQTELLIKIAEQSTVKDDTNSVFLTEKPSPLATFKGRENDIREISRLLDEQKNIVVVNGIGGIGKSEVCKKFVINLEDEIKASKCDRYSKIAFVRYVNTMKDSILAAFPEYADYTNVDESYQKILSILKRHGDKLLMLIDNLTDAQDLIESKILNMGFRVLVTSRIKNIARCRDYEIGKLSKEDCRALFYEFCQKYDDEYLDKILELVDYHTLVVELLAKTTHNSRISIKEMYNKLLSSGFNLKPVKIKVSQDEAVFEATFAEALTKLFKVIELSSQQKYILSNLALLPYLPIDVHKFVKWTEIDGQDDINYLVETGWLQESDDAVLMHPAIQETTRLELKPDLDTAEKLILALTNELRVKANDNFVDKVKYIELAVSVTQYFDKQNIDEIATLSNSIALRYEDMGEYNKALDFAQKSIEIKEQVLEPNHPSLATSYNNIAQNIKTWANMTRRWSLP